MKERTAGGREVIIEFHSVGSYVKVSAMDVESLTEASIVGDPTAGESELTRLAMQKLDYVLSKQGKTSGRRR